MPQMQVLQTTDTVVDDILFCLPAILFSERTTGIPRIVSTNSRSLVPYIYPLFSLTEAQGLWVWVGDGRGRGYGEGGRLEGRLLETKDFIFPGFTGALAVLYS